MHITPSDNPFRLKAKQTTGPTDYKPLEKLIDKITLTLSQIKSTTGRPNLPKDGMRLIHRLKTNMKSSSIKLTKEVRLYCWTGKHM